MRIVKTEGHNRSLRSLAWGAPPPSASLARSLLAPKTQGDTPKAAIINALNNTTRSRIRTRKRNNDLRGKTQMSNKAKIIQLVSHIVTAILSAVAGFFGAGI